jgi:hypothetical protein
LLPRFGRTYSDLGLLLFGNIIGRMALDRRVILINFSA